ncbi:hypothetical protein [Candidatus Vampirococcus lugosii]|uniref:PrgI family protein n=1 Tax=Candidatus Vampirococcus lugosii TaxID=2789015 RepID=A0ABS5QL44_9BACT|nr:hypothetical protein [Candidatus Vampirococcus lugosii]MBS8121936.1 hypothetical protein [Candidatus Vampirococcus lugosii]
MRVFVPRHISGGMFNMNLSIGPLTISMIQLAILAFGAVICLLLWQGLSSSGIDGVAAFVIILPVIIIFIVITFFKISELALLPFIAKLLRTYFFDEVRKFQTGKKIVDPQKVLLLRIKQSKPEQIVTTKKNTRIKNDKISKMDDMFN